MKKFLALVLAAVMALALVACGGGNSGSGNSGSDANAGANAGANSGADASAPDDSAPAGSYTIGICQYAPHPRSGRRHRGLQGRPQRAAARSGGI